MVNKEMNKGRLHTYLGLIELDIADLEENIKAIEERIAVMKAHGYETKPQGELLSRMLEALESLGAVRLEIMESLSADDKKA